MVLAPLTWLLAAAFDLAALALFAKESQINQGSTEGQEQWRGLFEQAHIIESELRFTYHALLTYLVRFRFSGIVLVVLFSGCDAGGPIVTSGSQYLQSRLQVGR
jgi:hypothetical protein